MHLVSDMDDDIEAALFAAGALSRAETAALRERLKHDPALAAKAGEWEAALSPLAAHAGEVAPPANLLDRIETRIDGRERLAQLSRLLHPEQGEWIALAPGVRFQELDRNEALRRWTILVEAAPGATFPSHEHDQDEEILMISGDLAFGDVELGPGDFYFSPKGSPHAAHVSRAGCRCIIAQAM